MALASNELKETLAPRSSYGAIPTMVIAPALATTIVSGLIGADRSQAYLVLLSSVAMAKVRALGCQLRLYAPLGVLT